jgi:putative adenylate-forming enzyme
MASGRRLVDAAVARRRCGELLRRDAWSDERLRVHQRERLAALVRHAVERSPFYRRRYAAVDRGADLARLPVIDKSTVMAHFDEIVTDPGLRLAAVERHLDGLVRDHLLLRRYRVTVTGGSTGRRGVFVADHDAWREYLAGLLRVNEWMGLRPGLPRRRVATIAAASPRHVTYRMSASLDVGLHRVLRLDASTPVERLVEPLNRFQPEFLYSYPSMLSLLAVEQAEGRLRISPTTLTSSGETHTDELRRAVRGKWDVPWFEIYGATEAPFLAASCPEQGRLHLFEDLSIVEIVDEDDRPVPDGQPGHRLLVTNLVNRVQPLIRYALADLVTVSADRCRCGRPSRVLAGVHGRNDDVLRLPAERGGYVAVHPLALRSAMAGVVALRQYTIVHVGQTLRVRVALRPDAAPGTAVDIADRLRTSLRAAGALPLDVVVTPVERIDGGRDAAGRLRVVQSMPHE